MPLGCNTSTSTTTTTTFNMEAEIGQTCFLDPIREISPSYDGDSMSDASSVTISDDFDEQQCLFCDRTDCDLDENLIHMSKAHGLHIDSTNLLVDIHSLLAYFHLVISERHECLYCGTQRSTRQAAQQHMMAKGHCKYDLTDEDSDLRHFYHFPTSDKKDEQQRNLIRMRLSHDLQSSSQARSRKPRPSRRTDRSSPEAPTQSPDQTQSPSPYNAAELRQLSTRALKQEATLTNQLTHLRASDRSSLLHLPASQQRAILTTQHKQADKARRTEQVYQHNLGSAGNKTNCLDKIRLIRKPPHTGNVHSLNR